MHLILLSLLVYMLLHKLRVKKDHYLHKLSRIFALSCLLWLTKIPYNFLHRRWLNTVDTLSFAVQLHYYAHFN